MRYYRIQFTDPKSGELLKRSGPGAGSWLFTSSTPNNNRVDPGALNIELDLPLYSFSAALGGAWLRIWGISLQDIGQASNLNPAADGTPRAAIQVYGGMAKGLPLAKPEQAGLLVSGIVQQAFGNWQGITQTLDIGLIADSGTLLTPRNIVLIWEKGAQLGVALQNCLTTAFPGFTVAINISSNLVATETTKAAYSTLAQLAQWANEVSQAIIGGNYQGVEMVMADKTITVYDGTSPTNPREIAFADLIGQPTWRSPFTISFATVMRADLKVGDYIKLPRTLATTNMASLSQYRSSSVFQGVFQISLVRHVGNFRSPDGQDWATCFEAYASGAQ